MNKGVNENNALCLSFATINNSATPITETKAVSFTKVITSFPIAGIMRFITCGKKKIKKVAKTFGQFKIISYLCSTKEKNNKQNKQHYEKW